MKNLIKNLYRKIFKENNESLITIKLYKDNLIGNINAFLDIDKNMMISPVLKSNAYGHGLYEISSILEKNTDKKRVPLFILDSYFEAKKLRDLGIKRDILIIGFSKIENILNNNIKNIIFTIADISVLRDLIERLNKPVNINLKIDTGMHRQGILEEDIDVAINLIKNNKNINLISLSSHFSDAEENENHTLLQIENWNRITEKFKKEFDSIRYFHISNTAGHRYMKEAYANMTRLGAGLYGIRDGAYVDNVHIKPVLQMETIITGIKKIKKGQTVGYGNSFEAKQDTTIATIPVGYYEGVDRRLSNRGFVKIDGKFIPMIGRVSMNITTIDITKIPNLKIGDSVIVISKEESDPNSMLNISKETTLARDLAVNIASHLKRVVID